MLDLKNLQNNFEIISKKLELKGTDVKLLEKLDILFTQIKKQKLELENYQAFQNKQSKELSIIAKNGGDIQTLKEQLSKNKENINQCLEIVRKLEEELEEISSSIPNIPDDDVPIGLDENDNIEIKKVLTPPKFDFKPLEHWQLAEKNNWIDFVRGVKISKRRFCILKNEASRLNRALINYMLKFNASRGFEEVSVPYIVNSNALFGTGQLPKFKEDLFKIENEDLYLIPTSEVPVTNIFNDEILQEENLPYLFTCYSTCFRSEAGSARKDTRGIIRQHQFDKIELVAITKPQFSDEMFEKMLNCASDLLTSLNLAHRLVNLCTGDLGFSAAKTIDLEVWLPGQNCYREISSVSNTRDFQARRAKIRYKDGKKNTLVHTLNGSSLAVGRCIVAIMENYQKSDGSIEIPKVLRDFM